MTDFVDPLEEPFGYDRNPRGALDPDAEEAYAAELEAERREREEEGESEGEPGSASDGDPLDPETPVDNLE